MAYSRSHINTNGAFELTEKSALLKTFDDIQAEIDAGGAFTPEAGPTALTDSTAGTPGATLAAVVGTTYSTDIPTIRNWIASLNAQINALQTALTTAGILT